MKAHDFRLEGGDERCSFATRDGTLLWIEIGGTVLTPDQLEELYRRYTDFDPTEEE